MAKKPKLVPLSAAFVKTTPDVKWSVVTDENIDHVVAEALKQTTLATDFETTGLKFLEDIKAVGLAWCWEKDHAWYLPLDHTWCNATDVQFPLYKDGTPRFMWDGVVPKTNYKNLSRRKALAAIRAVHEDPKVMKVGSNIKFDCRVSEEILGIIIENAFDIGDLARVTRDFMKVGLKELMTNELERWPYEEEKFRQALRDLRLKFPIDNDRLPVSAMAVYNAADVIFTRKLFYHLLRSVNTQDEKAILKMSSDLIPVLIDMEKPGIPLDTVYFKGLQVTLDRDMDKLTETAQRLTKNRDFNLGSPDQLREYLFGKEKNGGLGLKVVKMTSGGNSGIKQPSTDKDVIAILKSNAIDRSAKDGGSVPSWFNIFKIVEEYRWFNKLRGTYTKNLLAAADETGQPMIFADIKSDAARSGRLAASIMMTIPKRKDPSIIRKGFVANLPGEDEWELLEVDMDQVEFKIFAHYSHDPNLIQMIKDGVDFHTAVSAIMFNVPADDITAAIARVDAGSKDPRDLELKKFRSTGKTCNFALLYGAGTGRIAAELEIPFEEAKKLVKLYHERIPAVRNLQNKVAAIIRAHGCVRTYFGLVRRFPKFMAYAALDHIIQGTATGCLKQSLIKANRMLRERGMKTHILLPIHDAFWVRRHKDDDLFEVVAILNDSMTDYSFDVPLTASFDRSETDWASMEKFDVKERCLVPTWNLVRGRVDKGIEGGGTSRHDILSWAIGNRTDFTDRLKTVKTSIERTLKYRHNLLQWKENLEEYDSVWKEMIRARHAALN